MNINIGSFLKKVFVPIIIQATIITHCFSQSDTIWTKTYGGNEIDWCYSGNQTTDGGYILIGWTYSYGAGDRDAWLIKTDSEGDTTWTKTYGGSERDVGYSVQQTTDGGYIISGSTYSYGIGWSDVWLIKTNSEGETTWTKTYDESRGEGRSVKQTSDGGFIIIGSGDWLIKTDSLGDTLWTRNYNIWEGNDIQLISEGGYIITGITGDSLGGSDSNVALLRIDAEGDTLWSKAYGGSYDDNGRSVQQTNDGGFLIVGTSQYSLMTNALILRTDLNGDSLWSSTSDNFGWAYSVRQTTDEGFIIAGVLNSDVWLLKLSQDTINIDVDNDIHIPITHVLKQNYPNPFNPTTKISFELRYSEYVDISIYNIDGDFVERIVNNRLNAGVHFVDWDASNVSSGVYFYRIKTNSFTKTKKCLVIK